ncbi:MAG: YbdK family carboxylate-amine ligase [Epsilonproteobacteria bacterium]|nr:YbdK family carboxylate-amine ligase [Campylobacterota bacterium]
MKNFKTTYDKSLFDNNRGFSVGVELEVRLIDKENMKPANISPFLFEELPDDLKEYVHQELLQSMIEIVTPVCNSAKEARNFIMDTLGRLKKITNQKGVELAALATHPFERKDDNKFFPDPRYDELAQELGIVLKNFLISGFHIHIGMPNEKAAINSYNHTIHFLPLFIALSANSPFIVSEDTKLQSYRNKIFERLPRAGIPEYFETYKDYCELIDLLFITNTIKSVKDVWWDVRIHQKFGTIELRVADAFYDEERTELIVLLYQALLKYYSNFKAKRELYQISKQNKWNSVRHGLDGNFIEGSRVVTIAQKLHEVIEKLDKEGIFKELKAQDRVEALHRVVDKPSIATKLRKIYQETGSFEEVIKEEIFR